MATLDSNKVTSVSVVSNATDAVNKQYIDDNALPSVTGNSGRFLAVYPGASYWILRTSGTGGAIGLGCLTFGNNTYVAADSGGTLNT